MWGCVAQATKVSASPKMTKNDDFGGVLQKFHRNRDAIRLGISPGKFLMRRAPQAGQRVWVRHPIPLQWQYSGPYGGSTGDARRYALRSRMAVLGCLPDPYNNSGGMQGHPLAP